MGPTAQVAPQTKARVAGFAYLIVIVAGAFAEAFVRGRLVVPGDADATLHNIMAQELLFRSGFVANVVLLLANALLALIFYDLFTVVNRSLAMLAATLILLGSAVEGTTLLNHIAPLVFAQDGGYASAFTQEQTAAQAYIFLQLQSLGFNISLVLFGAYCLVTGYLIVVSTFVPRALGVLLAVGGMCYLTNSLVTFLAPAVGSRLLPYILVPCAVAETSLSLWLVIRGVDGQRWNAASSTRLHMRPAESTAGGVR